MVVAGFCVCLQTKTHPEISAFIKDPVALQQQLRDVTASIETVDRRLSQVLLSSSFCRSSWLAAPVAELLLLAGC
jgi:hypothetical protein